LDIKGILGLSRLVQGYGIRLSSGGGVPKKKREALDVPPSSVSLEALLAARLSRLERSGDVDDRQKIGAFVESVLVWEFGTDVEMDVSYAQLRDKLADDVHKTVSLKEQILKLIGSMQ